VKIAVQIEFFARYFWRVGIWNDLRSRDSRSCMATQFDYRSY